MLHFGIFGTFTGHSISLCVDNGTPDDGLYAQLMMKKHLTNINITYELQNEECYRLQSYR